jgi:hypothetical protein
MAKTRNTFSEHRLYQLKLKVKPSPKQAVEDYRCVSCEVRMSSSALRNDRPVLHRNIFIAVSDTHFC